jgi:hypothetical protein
VLKSIDFNAVSFDVLCVETTPDERPPGYAENIRAFLAPHGYVNATGQVGRNTCKFALAHVRSVRWLLITTLQGSFVRGTLLQSVQGLHQHVIMDR